MQSLILQYVPNAKQDQLVSTLRWVTCGGIKYCNDNCYLIISYSAVTGEPEFSRVVDILSFDLTYTYLLMSKCSTAFYDSHLLAYAITHKDELHIISVANLKHPFIIHSRKQFLKNTMYLSPNYHVCF